jgi:hypothetical protein
MNMTITTSNGNRKWMKAALLPAIAGAALAISVAASGQFKTADSAIQGAAPVASIQSAPSRPHVVYYLTDSTEVADRVRAGELEAEQARFMARNEETSYWVRVILVPAPGDEALVQAAIDKAIADWGDTGGGDFNIVDLRNP